ncbi:hypothetical protein QXB71_002697 [Vibrio cholerae]|nr:hypothetical protein [Vibrio cholerae]ELO1827460.1 hypothetical protein [Vibrio cholerae]
MKILVTLLISSLFIPAALADDQEKCKSGYEMVRKTSEQIADGSMPAPAESVKKAKWQLSESQKHLDKGDYCSAYKVFFE